jgi:hypothetical protein
MLILKASSPEGPTNRVSVLFFLFCLKTEAESSFRNVVILQFYNLEGGQSLKEQFYISHHRQKPSNFDKNVDEAVSCKAVE